MVLIISSCQVSPKYARIPIFFFDAIIDAHAHLKSRHLTNSAARADEEWWLQIFMVHYMKAGLPKKEEEMNDPFSWRVRLLLIETSSTMRSDYFSTPLTSNPPTPHPPLCRMIERVTGRESPVIRSDFSDRRLICDRIYSSGEHVNRFLRNPPETVGAVPCSTTVSLITSRLFFQFSSITLVQGRMWRLSCWVNSYKLNPF